MRDLFRAFDGAGVRYLLIGGQASILYGAANFTQDFDLWVEPSDANLRAMVKSLSSRGARVHKLTPPMTSRWMRRGHGFHFVLPARSGAIYLDVMGKPPRSRGFAVAAGRSTQFDTPWGDIPVVAVEDLVDLKRTDRPGDYETVSRLVRIRLAEGRRPRAAWAMKNVFRLDDLVAVLRQLRPARVPPAFQRLAKELTAGREGSDSARAVAQAELDRRLLACMAAGRAYWRPRIEELKRMRRDGILLPEGSRL